MKKKLDWDHIKTPFGAKPLPGQPQRKYTSGRDYIQKGIEQEKEQLKMRETLAKAQPMMEALLKCRIEDGVPLVVNRPVEYVISELVHNYNQTWDDKNCGWVRGEVTSSVFQDVRKSLRAGTELILKSLDPNLQEFIFQDQDGNEVVIPYGAKQALLMQTNIYDDVIKFMNNLGE